jgi:hypothetical protein
MWAFSAYLSKNKKQILADPDQQRPSHMSPNAGGGKAAGSQPMRTAVHITRHGAQCKFWRSNSIFNLCLGSSLDLTCSRRVRCGRGGAQQRHLTRHRNRRAALCTRLGHRELARRDRRQLGRGGGGGVRGVGRVVECPSIYIQ